MQPHALIIKFLLLIFLLSACTRNKFLLRQNVDSRAINELNYLGKTKEGSLKFNSGKIIRVKKLKVLPNDSLQYKPANSENIRMVGLSEIRNIDFKDHWVGIFDGSLFGFLGGIVGGCLYVDKDNDMAGYLVAAAGAGGLLTGAIIGGIIGSKIKYRIKSKTKRIPQGKTDNGKHLKVPVGQ